MWVHRIEVIGIVKKKKKTINETEIWEKIIGETSWDHRIFELKLTKTDINLNGIVIYLDNGGGATSGKASPWTLHNVAPEIPFKEYEFTRKVTAKLQELLVAMRATVYMVSPEVGVDITPSARVARANTYKTSYKEKGWGEKFLFVSVHANASGDGSKWISGDDGWSVCTKNEQKDCNMLANCFLQAAKEIFEPTGRKVLQQCDNNGNYVFNVGENSFIKNLNMPAVLTLNFFYTDPDDCAFISSERGVELVAIAHAKGIVKFAQQKYGVGIKQDY